MRVGKFVFTRGQNIFPNERLAKARKQILLNTDLVVDIGANSGDWIKGIRKGGFFGPAICIEPLKKNYEELKFQAIPNITYLNCAVGNKNGYIYINQASNNGLSSSILQMDEYHKKGAPEIIFVGKERVKIKKLSTILHKSKSRKMFIKIDTQGYELEVVKSINKPLWSSIYGFEIEVNLVSTYKNSVLIEDLVKFLRKRGFQPFRVEAGFGLPNFGQQLQMDILFIKI